MHEGMQSQHLKIPEPSGCFAMPQGAAASAASKAHAVCLEDE